MGEFRYKQGVGEGTIQFRPHDGCITTLQVIRYIPESRYNLIPLGALHREGFCFSLKGDLMKVFKETHVIFQTCRQCIYVVKFRDYSQ